MLIVYSYQIVDSRRRKIRW